MQKERDFRFILARGRMIAEDLETAGLNGTHRIQVALRDLVGAVHKAMFGDIPCPKPLTTA
jgi:hypothetical protein